jgi:hypothetical protein
MPGARILKHPHCFFLSRVWSQQLDGPAQQQRYVAQSNLAQTSSCRPASFRKIIELRNNLQDLVWFKSTKYSLMVQIIRSKYLLVPNQFLYHAEQVVYKNNF